MKYFVKLHGTMSDPSTEPAPKLPKPHRCNDRVEDLLQASDELPVNAA